VEKCISSLPQAPIVVRLSGWIHTSDRLALLDIARQINKQAEGRTVFPTGEEGDEEPQVDDPTGADVVALPPSSHLHALISMLPTLSRPVIVILDSFDLLALHPRQALLYCFLDVVQSCQSGSSTKGLVVIGMTTRLDTINMLEKRVKSRFSGRIIRTAAPSKWEYWSRISSFLLSPPIPAKGVRHTEEWNSIWSEAIKKFINDDATINVFKDAFGVSRDVTSLTRLLVGGQSRSLDISQIL
jgi:origin recognition complex subunit 4